MRGHLTNVHYGQLMAILGATGKYQSYSAGESISKAGLCRVMSKTVHSNVTDVGECLISRLEQLGSPLNENSVHLTN